MGIIIPESQYHFLKPECRTLDLEVDRLTHAFESDVGLREVMAEQYSWDHAPTKWRETSMVSIPARITQAMLIFIDVGRAEVGHYALPTIILPREMADYARQLALREHWNADLGLQSKVETFEKTLETAYFDFCKQSMNNLLLHINSEPLIALHSPRYQAVHASVQQFSPEVFSGCDTAYYNAGRRKLADAATPAEELKKDNLGSMFVMMPEDIQAYMSQF